MEVRRVKLTMLNLVVACAVRGKGLNHVKPYHKRTIDVTITSLGLAEVVFILVYRGDISPWPLWLALIILGVTGFVIPQAWGRLPIWLT
jgi:hypothetical protein